MRLSNKSWVAGDDSDDEDPFADVGVSFFILEIMLIGP
jgi:hypothetical protein